MSISISLISGTSKSFKLIQKRVALRPNPSKKQGFDFGLVTDLDSMRENFKELLRSLPDTPGILVISGVSSSNLSSTIKVLRSNESIRAVFGSFNDGYPFNWLSNKLLEGGYKEIQLQLGTSA